MAQGSATPPTKTAEELRLDQAREEGVPWRQWGPYLSERQWATVREDYSQDGNAWDYFSHDQARSRAYFSRAARLQIIFEPYLFPISGPRPFKVGTIVARLHGGVDPNLAGDPKRVTAFKGYGGRVIWRSARVRHNKDIARWIAARSDSVIDRRGVLDVGIRADRDHHLRIEPRRAHDAH